VTQYLLRRLALMAPVAFLVSVAVFGLVHLTPGDPALLVLGEDASPAQVVELRRELGLDRSLPEQYVIWLGRLLRGDLGRSIRSKQPVTQVIVERLPNTLELGLTALGWALAVSIPLGTLAALRRGTFLDVLSTSFTIAGVSVPNFVIGLLLIFGVAVTWRLLPPGGFVAFPLDPGDNLRRLVLPALTLGTAAAAVNMRFTRSSMIEVLNQDYIRTARAKGAGWTRVVARHALKNALIPVVTVVGIQVGQIIEGAVVTETVFAWPGVGKYAVDSILTRDYPIIQGVVLLFALSFMVANLLVDLAYAWLDPRITYA
jgi:ABC-type dipeptide/oligopeptide/nickel transport system permease component